MVVALACPSLVSDMPAAIIASTASRGTWSMPYAKESCQPDRAVRLTLAHVSLCRATLTECKSARNKRHQFHKYNSNQFDFQYNIRIANVLCI